MESADDRWWELDEGDRIAARLRGWSWFVVEHGEVVGNGRKLSVAQVKVRLSNDHWFKVYDASTRCWRDGPELVGNAPDWKMLWDQRDA